MQGNKEDTDVENRLLDSVGGGEGGMIWENSAETCILPYGKERTSASSMHEIEGWDRGEGVSEKGEHMYTSGRFMLMYGENHHNVLIILQLK